MYNALESEHTVVQERALAVVPDLCETIDYAEVQGVLFPRVAVSPSWSTLFLAETESVNIARLHEDTHLVRQGRNIGDLPSHGQYP